jgi:hypothetical protein
MITTRTTILVEFFVKSNIIHVYTHLTIFLCFNSFSKQISLSAELGTPCNTENTIVQNLYNYAVTSYRHRIS